MSIFKKDTLSTTEKVDIIENILYEFLKPYGFKKYGRTLHRFVDGDISQVIELENGCPAKGIVGVLWVHLGVRVPECVERSFTIGKLKKYDHEYECNIRTDLGMYIHGKDVTYNLKKKPETIAEDIIKNLKKHIIPIFDSFNSRTSIIKNRRYNKRFDETNNHLILLEEAMIYGRMGDINKAQVLFNAYYKEAVNDDKVYKNPAHIEYLNELARNLEIPIYDI